jgi:hypothetical protein
VLTVSELQARLDELRRVRSEGRRELRYANGRHIVYGSDAELADAISDLERQIAASTTTPVHTVLVGSSKGLQ